jgi:hypothetical protein
MGQGQIHFDKTEGWTCSIQLDNDNWFSRPTFTKIFSWSVQPVPNLTRYAYSCSLPESHTPAKYKSSFNFTNIFAQFTTGIARSGSPLDPYMQKAGSLLLQPFPKGKHFNDPVKGSAL